jgi:hypothetical protein
MAPGGIFILEIPYFFFSFLFFLFSCAFASLG